MQSDNTRDHRVVQGARYTPLQKTICIYHAGVLEGNRSWRMEEAINMAQNLENAQYKLYRTIRRAKSTPKDSASRGDRGSISC